MRKMNQKLLATLLLTGLALVLLPAIGLADEESAARPAESGPPTVLDFVLSAKYLVMIGLMIVALVLLMWRKINIWVRIAGMITAFVVYGTGWVYGLHPSPMCALTKLYMFRFTTGRFIAIFVAFTLIMLIASLVGKKLFCGWVCPLGAFQELINKIPHRFKVKQFSFLAFNSIRLGLLVLFFVTFKGVRDQVLALGERQGADTTDRIWQGYSAYSVYEPINMFELLHWHIDTVFIVLMSILVIASFVLYRPFCYLVCPIGAITWLFEQIAPGRIRIDLKTCDDCGMCVTESPCPTLKPLLEGKTKAIPDCTSCGECLNTCPSDSIDFGFVAKK